MSGTSADGIDAALVSFSPGLVPKLIDFLTYPIDYQNELAALNKSNQISLDRFAQLQRQIGERFADATLALLNKSQVSPQDIQAIGSHGQTIYHAPQYGMSLQIGHPAIIAKRTGICTAADFRIDDMALEGQGAPLAPAFHRTLTQSEHTTCMINIGGISNISVLYADGRTLGFDTGPGNGLMDEICQQQFDQAYDTDGLIAAQAEPDAALLAKLLQDPYFSQAFPKSTGRETFNQAWLSGHLESKIEGKTLISTLNQLTVETLAMHLEQLNLAAGTVCYICGGGAFNLTLLQRLNARLSDLKIESIQQLGFDPNAVEAMMCAWLAKQRLARQPIDYTQITGATRPSVLGAIWHP